MLLMLLLSMSRLFQSVPFLGGLKILETGLDDPINFAAKPQVSP